MNPVIKQLAEEAGFSFWQNESWGPGEGHIDWSSIYDKEFEKYTELLIKECAIVVFRKIGPKSALDVLNHFGIEE